jgi:hypothetical protein
MNSYVIIFRQNPQALSGADLKRRAEETSGWARRHNDAGHKLAPHILKPDSVHYGPHSEALRADTQPVTALLLLQARDLDEAAQVAGSHPALRYGANVEVRPWAPPQPLP